MFFRIDLFAQDCVALAILRRFFMLLYSLCIILVIAISFLPIILSLILIFK